MGIASRLLSTISGISKTGAMATVAAGGAGTAILAGQGFYAAQTGERSWVNRIMGWGTEELNAAGARGEAEGFWMGIYATLERLGEFIQNLTNGRYGAGLERWAQEAQGIVPADANPVPVPDYVATNANGAMLSGAELTVDNFSQGLENIGEVDLLHKANVLGHGLAEGGVQAISVVGHAYDAVDTIVGGTLGFFSSSAREWYGDQERDASQAIYDGGMSVVNSAWTAVAGGPPELSTAWDRALHFGGEIGGAVLTGGALARGVSMLGTAFGANASGAALATTSAGVRQAAIWAPTPR